MVVINVMKLSFFAKLLCLQRNSALPEPNDHKLSARGDLCLGTVSRAVSSAPPSRFRQQLS